jgi:bacterioferritin-associated ferredoxin
MIVCSCNVLTDVDIRASIATLDGPRRVCDVYASLGCAAKCGGCAGTICALISEAKGRDFGTAQTNQGGKPRGEVTHALAKGIDTLNLALKSELSAMPRAVGRSPHLSIQRWNWSDTSRNVEELDIGDRAGRGRQRKIEPLFCS